MNDSTVRPRHPASMRQAFLWVLLPTLVLILIAPSVGDAQQVVTTNITSTAGAGDLGTTVTQEGNFYNITGGIRPGGVTGANLFHSFEDFNVGAGDIGNFLNDTGLPTVNILGRVTGGNVSNIYGAIQTTGFGNANLFLVNPSGIVFGPHGSFDVGGSVSFSTAQYLRLFDGINSANFYANPANDGLANSVFAMAPVVDFGFLSPAAYGFLTQPDPNATITVRGSALAVPSGQSISLVGGKVVIQGATLPDLTVQRAQLSAPNGRILLASTASPGEFDSTTLLSLPNVDGVSGVSFTSYATASLGAGSSIDVSGGHTAWIKGGQLVLSVNDATLNTSGNTAPQNTISLGLRSVILTQNSGTDLGADVQLIASKVQIAGASFIVSQTDGSGGGGDVNVKADSMVLSGGSTIGSFTNGSGAGGGISITAKSLDLKGLSTVNSNSNGTGSNGHIVVSVQEARLSNGAAFENSTTVIVEGGAAGGKITVQGLQGEGSKADSLILEGQNTGLKSGVVASGIEVHAKIVSMTDRAVIQVGDPLSTATPGNIIIDADSVSIAGGSFILSQAFGFNAGSVTIKAGEFSLNQSSIQTNTASPIGGDGGDVFLKVGSASLTNGARINSSSEGTGNAGNITINSDSNILMQNSSVTTEASQASGGQVTFTAPDMIQLVNSNISTSVAGSDVDTVGGNITIDPQFVVLQGGQIVAKAFAGSGGAIDIIATSAFIRDPASIVDASSTLGISGTINIQSPLQNIGGELAPLSDEFSSAAALLAQQCAARAAGGKFSTFVVAAREGLPAEPGGFLASPSLTAESLGSRLSGRDSHPEFSTVTGAFPEYEARPIQLAKLGNACHQ